MHNEILLNKLLPPCSIVQSGEAGFTVSTRNGDGFDYSFVSDSEISKIDRRLPAAMRLFEKEVNSVESIFVLHMLDLWSTDNHFKMSNGDLLGVTRVLSLTFTALTLNIRGNGFIYRVFQNPENEGNLLIPTRTSPSIAAIEKKWLDQNHPGWADRYQFASDLGMPLQDAFNAMVCIAKPEATIQLPTGDLTLS